MALYPSAPALMIIRSLRVAFRKSTTTRPWLSVAFRHYSTPISKLSPSATITSERPSLSTSTDLAPAHTELDPTPPAITKVRLNAKSLPLRSKDLNRTTPPGDQPLHLHDLDPALRIEVWSSKLVRYGKETRIEVGEKLGVFEMGFVLKQFVRPGTFLARMGKDPDILPKFANLDGFLVVPFETGIDPGGVSRGDGPPEAVSKPGNGEKKVFPLVKLGLVSTPQHLSLALQESYVLLSRGDKVMVKVHVNMKKKMKSDKRFEIYAKKLSSYTLGRNPHVWPATVAKCMPKGTTFREAMLNHEEGYATWIMERGEVEEEKVKEASRKPGRPRKDKEAEAEKEES